MRRITAAIVAFMTFTISGCSSMARSRIAELRTLYDQGQISRQTYVTETSNTLREYATTPEQREYAAYFGMQGSRWVRDEISREQFNYLMVAKENELRERRAQRDRQYWRDFSNAVSPKPKVTCTTIPLGGGMTQTTCD